MPKPYIKQFEIRWSDVDANRHLANTAYSAYMVHTRMSFLTDNGVTLESFVAANIGPVILNEHLHYIRELLPTETVNVDVELGGLSEDKRFVQFNHHVYNQAGKIAAYGEVLIAWISLETRKMVVPPDDWNRVIDAMVKSESFKIITGADTRFEHVPYQRSIELI